VPARDQLNFEGAMDEFSGLGKLLIWLGIALLLAGLLLSGKLPWLGRLPGDIRLVGERWSFYFPLTSMLVISLVVSFVLWLLRR